MSATEIQAAHTIALIVEAEAVRRTECFDFDDETRRLSVYRATAHGIAAGAPIANRVGA